MTTSSYTKLLKQIGGKSVKHKRYLRFNVPKPRKFGKETKQCIRCGNRRGHIDKYGLDLCRCCFREIATKIGFKKYS